MRERESGKTREYPNTEKNSKMKCARKFDGFIGISLIRRLCLRGARVRSKSSETRQVLRFRFSTCFFYITLRIVLLLYEKERQAFRHLGLVLCLGEFK